jgi:hypothetical protein
MKKMTVKRFEKFMRDFHPEFEFTQEENNELYQLYSQIDSMSENLISCLEGIRKLIFVWEKVDNYNVDYFKSLDIDYSSSIFSNKLLRHYSFEVLSHVLKCGMREVRFEYVLFFENNNPKMWTKKFDFYQSKLKKVCTENTYVPMTELLDKLYRVLVKLHFDLKLRYFDEVYFFRLYERDLALYKKIFGDQDGNFDESFILSDYYFKSTEADEILSNYESMLLNNCNTRKSKLLVANKVEKVCMSEPGLS